VSLTNNQQAELIQFTQEMVRCPGFSGEEAGTAEVVKRQMARLSFDRVEVDSWGNVIGTIQGRTPGPTIVFDGHMDVVPVRMPELWTRDPYGAEIADGKIWGRGSTDMKGGLAASLCAAGFMDRSKINGTIIVTATIAEELMIGKGLGKALESRDVDAVITCEPTGTNHLAIAGVGRTTVEMTVHGQVAHSSRPQLGDNAIYRAINASKLIRFMPRRQDAFFGEEVVELVEMKSKPSPGNGSVPDFCWLLWECRLLPEETRESFLGRFESALSTFPGKEKLELKIGEISLETYTGNQLVYEDFLDAWSTPPDNGFRILVEKAINKAGIIFTPIIFRGCTNVNVSAGALKIPSLIYGPGSLDLAHKPNEYLEIEELLLSAEVYSNIIELTN
jgi:putative selenium metabolism hydrolase